MTEQGSPVDLKRLIIDWLTEWKNAAARYGSKMEFVYKNALKSLREHPDPVFTVKDVRKIKFFGDKLTVRVNDAVKQHFEKNGLSFQGLLLSTEDDAVAASSSLPTKKSSKKSKESTSEKNDKDNTANKRNRKTTYVPKPNSGGYAILVALFIADREGRDNLSKTELQERAQAFCSESMTKGKNNSHYTAWSSMKTLINNGLVDVENKRCSYYSLTHEGQELGRKLVAHREGKDIPVSQSNTHRGSDEEDCFVEDGVGSSQASQMFSSQSTVSSMTSSQLLSQEKFCLKAGSFEIVLLIDSRESASGVSSELKKTAIISEFLKNGIMAEMRALPAGDFTWIAREKHNASNSQSCFFSGSQSRGRELVLDVVIERKRVDDLASSIVDGRFHEQKHRLKICGVRRPSYLVESLHPNNQSTIVAYRTLLMAVTNSQIIDGFSIKCTNNQKETLMYLANMTGYLKKTFLDKTLYSCTHEEMSQEDNRPPEDHFMSFSEFEQSAKKVTNFTVKEMFLKHLLQLTGVSVVKAKAITDMFPTVKHLLQAYDECASLKEKEKLLASIKSENMLKAVGPVASKKIFQYYTYQKPLQSVFEDDNSSSD